MLLPLLLHFGPVSLISRLTCLLALVVNTAARYVIFFICHSFLYSAGWSIQEKPSTQLTQCYQTDNMSSKKA